MIETLLSDMFVLDVPLLEKLLRTILVYALLLFLLRLAGRRELAQLNPFDFVVLLMLSNTVQNAIIGNDNTFVGGAIGAVVLVVVNQLVVRFVFRHQQIERAVDDNDTLLISNGVVSKTQLRKLAISVHELTVAARKQGFDSLEEIDSADINSLGSFTFKRCQPTMDEQRQQDLLDRLNLIAQELKEIKLSLAK